jgi:hypothetical protein
MEDGAMAKKDLDQCREQTEATIHKEKEIDNAKRTLTMLEKALERVLRRNYYNQDQYPQIAFEIEEQINTLRGWIQDYQIYCALPNFLVQVGLAMKDLESKIGQLMALCKPLDGKKRIKKNSGFKSTMNFADQLIACWNI